MICLIFFFTGEIIYSINGVFVNKPEGSTASDNDLTIATKIEI